MRLNMESTRTLLWGLVFLAGSLCTKAGYQERQRNTLWQKYNREADPDFVTKKEFEQVSSTFQSQMDLMNKNLLDLQQRFQKDHCSGSPCVNQGICTNRLDDYTCICKPGFGGKNCDKETGLSDTKVLTVTNGGAEGIWYPWSVCPPGSFARNFRIKLERALPDGDDTAMNNIMLYCRNVVTGKDEVAIHGPELFGNWREWQNCPNGEYLVGFAMNVEGDQGEGDDTAVNGVRMICSGGRSLTGPIAIWGSFGNTSKCPKSHYICGVQIKQEPPQPGTADDSSLNDIVFKCCAWW